MSSAMRNLCAPHLERGMNVRGTRSVDGTAMCADCFAGREIRKKLEPRQTLTNHQLLALRKMEAERERTERLSRRRAAMKAAWARPGAKERRRAAQKAAWARPVYRTQRRRHSDAPSSDEKANIQLSAT